MQDCRDTTLLYTCAQAGADRFEVAGRGKGALGLGCILEQVACTNSVSGMHLKWSHLTIIVLLFTYFVLWQVKGTRNTNAGLAKERQVSTCPDHLSAQDIILEALARDVRDISMKSDTSSFPVLVLAEITGHQSGTFWDQLWKAEHKLWPDVSATGHSLISLFLAFSVTFLNSVI